MPNPTFANKAELSKYNIDEYDGKHESFLTIEWENLSFSCLFSLIVKLVKVCSICNSWTLMITANNYSRLKFWKDKTNMSNKIVQEYIMSTAFTYLISVFARNSKEISSLVAFVGLEFLIILFHCLLNRIFDWWAVHQIGKNFGLPQ